MAKKEEAAPMADDSREFNRLVEAKLRELYGAGPHSDLQRSTVALRLRTNITKQRLSAPPPPRPQPATGTGFPVIAGPQPAPAPAPQGDDQPLYRRSLSTHATPLEVPVVPAQVAAGHPPPRRERRLEHRDTPPAVAAVYGAAKGGHPDSKK